jgi:hypothetical protein
VDSALKLMNFLVSVSHCQHHLEGNGAQGVGEGWKNQRIRRPNSSLVLDEKESLSARPDTRVLTPYLNLLIHHPHLLVKAVFNEETGRE